MLLTDVACVLADTARSQAYIQALVQHDLRPAKCLVMSQGAGMGDFHGKTGPWNPRGFHGIPNGIPYEVLNTSDINSDEMKNAVQALSQRYIIYSGYGGAILKPHLFQLGKKWIHVHAGLLPAYRGSTTAYYSALDCGRMGATAIFLNERIDEGSIITAAEFPQPERGELVDYVYDPYIRSQVLVKALQEYVRNGEFKEVPQAAEGAETYYIIHPVLKHIAILGMNSDEGQE